MKKDICVITGGAGAMGIGAAKRIAAEDNMAIIIVDLSQEALDAGVKELEDAGLVAYGFKMDVTNKEQAAALARFASEKGTVKGLINLAGISPKGGPDYHVPGSLVFDVPAKGTVYISDEIARVMSEGGCIINITSASPFLSPPGTMGEELYPLALEDFEKYVEEMHDLLAKEDEQTGRNRGYVNARYFIMHYTEYFACKVGRDGIRVVSVGPGVVDGPMVEESGLGLAKMSACGRTGRPEELADIYAFLLSDKASYITGTNIMADGGIVAAIHTMKR